MYRSLGSVVTVDAPAVIHSAEELCALGESALVVYAPADTLRRVVQAYRQGHGKLFEARIQHHTIKGRPFVCAVFVGLCPGTYHVCCLTLERTTNATLLAKHVTQVDWRRPAVS